MVFVALLFITAPYGRHVKATWGPLIDNRLGWVLMEVTGIFVLYYFVFSGINQQSLVNYIIILLFSVHYLNRSFVFPFRIHTRGKKMPLSIAVMGMTFNIVNGFLIGYYLGNFKIFVDKWLVSLPFLAGIIIFISGMVINFQSDTILIRLRKPGETGYKIPYGRMFKYVSCPNLFGEVIEWAGFAILTMSLPGLAFFIWTFANLVPRARDHHRWYLQKFENYPRERRVIFPFLF